MEFKTYALSSVGKIITGKTPPANIENSFSEKMGVPFITPKDMDGRKEIRATERYLTTNGVKSVENYLIPPRTVAVSCIGSDMGKAIIIPCKAVTNQQINSIIINQEFNYEYIYYALSTKQQKLKSIAGGSATPILNKGHFSQFELEIPNREYQDWAVGILKAFDDKIQLNTETNQTLEAIAQAIFKSWFIDFDPVHAKANALAEGNSEADANRCAMQTISGKNQAELDDMTTQHPEAYAQLLCTAEAFPSAFGEDGLPLGWEMSTIGAEIETVGGATPSTKNTDFWENGDIHWTTPKDLSGLADKILIDTDRKITKQGLAKISSGLLPVDTVLMSSRAPVGYLALAKIPVAINQGYIAMKCNKRLSSFYVLQWCHANMDEIQTQAGGTTFQEISKNTFRAIECIVPPLELIENFSKNLTTIYQKIEKNVIENNMLAKTRDELLPKLLNGEIPL